MNDEWVESIDEERDLGLLISKGLKFSRPKNKANSMLGIINRRVIKNLNKLQDTAS